MTRTWPVAGNGLLDRVHRATAIGNEKHGMSWENSVRSLADLRGIVTGCRVHSVSPRFGTFLGHLQIGRTRYRSEAIAHIQGPVHRQLAASRRRPCGKDIPSVTERAPRLRRPRRGGKVPATRTRDVQHTASSMQWI